MQDKILPLLKDRKQSETLAQTIIHPACFQYVSLNLIVALKTHSNINNINIGFNFSLFYNLLSYIEGLGMYLLSLNISS